MMDKHDQAGPLRRLLSRRSVLAGAAVGVVAPTVVASAATLPAAAAGAAAARGITRQITMYAEKVGTGYGYGLEPGKASVPGPLLEIYEGDTLEIELVNNTDKRLSIHAHGVNYDVNSDGSPLHLSYNEPGETRVYTWTSQTRYRAAGTRWMPGSAGYWHYHDHAMGEHGTAGLIAGLYGGLIVRKRGDLLPDRQYTVVFNDMTINNKMAPDTPMFEANQGERVEWVCIGHGGMPHTFHLHGHRWADNRTGYFDGETDQVAVLDNKNLDPGASFGFQVVAGEGVGPGVWMYHCHVQFHADGGMVGLWLIRNPDGSMPAGAQDAIDRFQQHGHTGH